MTYKVKLTKLWDVVSELPPILFERDTFPARFALTRNSASLLKFSRFYAPSYSSGETLNLWSANATLNIWKANCLVSTLPLKEEGLLDLMSPHSILNHEVWIRMIDRVKFAQI